MCVWQVLTFKYLTHLCQHHLSAALCLHKTPLSSTGWKWSWLQLSPHESTHYGSAGSIFQHSTWIIAGLCIEGNVFSTLPSFSHLSLALWRPQQLTTGGYFFKVNTLTFTNRGGLWPRLLLTICVSPYGKDAFMSQIAQEADKMGS